MLPAAQAASDVARPYTGRAPRIDPVAVKIDWSRQRAGKPSVPIGARIDLGSELTALGDAVRREGQARKAEPSSAELRRAHAMALTERLERRHRATE